MDFRNNLVTLNDQTFGLKVSNTSHVNIIDNTIINNTGAGIKYTNNSTFYRSGNIISGNTQGNETFDGTCTEKSEPIIDPNAPYPNWLENVVTPTDKTQVGMGSGKCQCVLCR
jgi:parallel beta-helix repeat protein